MSAKEIEGWEDYTIDIKGNVFSKKRNKYLKQTVDKYGYCRVNLQKDKKILKYQIDKDGYYRISLWKSINEIEKELSITMF